jgi:hypothetical protein
LVTSLGTPRECEGENWHWDMAYFLKKQISKEDACLDQDLRTEGQNIFVTNVMNLCYWSTFLTVGKVLKVGKLLVEVIVCVVMKSTSTKNV